MNLSTIHGITELLHEKSSWTTSFIKCQMVMYVLQIYPSIYSCEIHTKQITSSPLPVYQSRALAGCREGSVALAVNGRAGRRVACVLGEGGMALEVFDMESEEEEEGDMAEE